MWDLPSINRSGLKKAKLVESKGRDLKHRSPSEPHTGETADHGRPGNTDVPISFDFIHSNMFRFDGRYNVAVICDKKT